MYNKIDVTEKDLEVFTSKFVEDLKKVNQYSLDVFFQLFEDFQGMSTKISHSKLISSEHIRSEFSTLLPSSKDGLLLWYQLSDRLARKYLVAVLQREIEKLPGDWLDFLFDLNAYRNRKSSPISCVGYAEEIYEFCLELWGRGAPGSFNRRIFTTEKLSLKIQEISTYEKKVNDLNSLVHRYIKKDKELQEGSLYLDFVKMVDGVLNHKTNIRVQSKIDHLKVVFLNFIDSQESDADLRHLLKSSGRQFLRIWKQVEKITGYSFTGMMHLRRKSYLYLIHNKPEEKGLSSEKDNKRLFDVELSSDLEKDESSDSDKDSTKTFSKQFESLDDNGAKYQVAKTVLNIITTETKRDEGRTVRIPFKKRCEDVSKFATDVSNDKELSTQINTHRDSAFLRSFPSVLRWLDQFLTKHIFKAKTSSKFYKPTRTRSLVNEAKDLGDKHKVGASVLVMS